MPSTTYPLRFIVRCLFKNLAWVAIAISLFITFILISNLFWVDFIHANKNRTQQNAALFAAIFTPITIAISLIGTAVIFSLSQGLQSLFAFELLRRLNNRHLCLAALFIPLAAAISWYCYDYLTPSDFNLGINEGADWVPYKHGMTIHRYLSMLLAQSCITLFSLLCLQLEMSNRRHTSKILLTAVLLFSSLTGMTLGIYRAT